MIPRTLVPPDARPTTFTTSPGRASALDERTLISGQMAAGPLEEKSNIPSNIPLESIAQRVVVPRDVKILPYFIPAIGDVTAQPSTLDERIAVPVDARPPDSFVDAFTRPDDLVEGDVFTTGEVQLLVKPVEKGSKRTWEYVTRFGSGLLHAMLIGLILWQPKLFRRRPPTPEDIEIARKQLTMLLPPGKFDFDPPRPVPKPPEHIHITPGDINKVAPPIPTPAPTPQPEPKPEIKDLPSAPTPQKNPVQPPPQPEPKTEVASNLPLKLEKPEIPKPQQGLVLPKYGTSRPIEDAARPAPNATGPTYVREVPLPRTPNGGPSLAASGLTVLTPTDGVDLTEYFQRVMVSVNRNWSAVYPESALLGEKGVVRVLVRVMRDGSVPQGYPGIVQSSGKEPLDRAAISSVRASNPFPPFPPIYTRPYIDFYIIYPYNVPIESLYK